ncbi:hypothetical protein CUT44_06205 [Streptomyces carminius]|uniref:Uncharacterized protein n=1 Tax=Streptomyces carminius TaxID=2665496 RepID=A0A2M8M4Q1_9ACTN|nr:hypothetical protein [Streptomyces carminius]PJE99174.1 hypothetical protein CUT44_06205 [Streptomyces carminius]
MRILVPYSTLVGEVTFKVTAAKLDGRELPLEMISQQERVVAVHQAERRTWDEARLELRAELPDSELASDRWTDVTCVAVLTEGVTNSRTVTRLHRSSAGDWNGSITLARDSYRNRAELSVNVVATVDGVAGRVIGSSEDDWIVDLVARTPVRQREINFNEVDFRDGEEDWLRPFKDAPWLVETSGDMPTVHLNTGFEGVVELLDSNGSPLEKAVRGVLAAQIATDTWTAMFHAAVSDLETDEDGTPQWPSGWRDSVLRGMLPDVLPDVSAADALWDIHARRAESVGWSELQSRIQYAASRRARVARNLGTAIRVLDRSDERAS